MLANRMQRQVRSEVESLVLHAVILALRAEVTEAEWQQLMEDITTRERDPYSVAIELQKRVGLHTLE
jgi:LAO/AO transport system kinase